MFFIDMLPRSLPWTLRSNYVLLFAVINKIQSPQDGAIPQDKLTNLPFEQEENIHCNPHPETHQVPLPELCQIHYPSNGTTVRTFFYTTAHCPNCLCKGASETCSETRCCCGPTETTNLTYTCSEYLGGVSVLVSDIPTKCECQPCGEMQVSVIIRVLDCHGEPVVMANITVDGVQSYQSDEQGYVGFLVPASQVKVNVGVQALLFRDFQRHYFIIPGKVNLMTIHLQASRTVTLIPPQTPFIISFPNLEIKTAPESINFDYLEIDQLIDVMDLLDKFDPKFGEIFAYFPAKVFPRDKQFTFTTSMPQTLYEDLTQELLDVSFLLKRQKKLAGAYHDIPLFALGWGQLEIYDEDGRPFDPLTPLSEEHYSILLGLSPSLSHSLSQPKLNDLRLYSYNKGSQTFKVLKERPYMYKNHASEIQWAVFPIYLTLPSFPLSLAIAVEEQHACYLAARANDPFQLIDSNLTQATTMVHAVARLGSTNISSSRDYLVFMNQGEINSCIAVPCHGELALHVMDNSKLQASYGMSIVDNYERYNSNSGHVGPVYKTRRGCEAIGLESELDSSDHIVLDLTMPTMDHTTELAEAVEQNNFIARAMARGMQLEALTSTAEEPEFCSVKVSVRICSDSTVTVTCIAGGEVMVKSLSSEESTAAAMGNGEEDPDDLEWVSGDSDDDWLSGPAYGQNRYQSKCNRLQHACFTFSCESRVNLSVVSMTDSSDGLNVYHDAAFDLLTKTENDTDLSMQYNSVPCLPRSNFHSPNLDSSFKSDSSLILLNIAAHDSAQFVFESTSGGERGIFRSLSTREVAQQKCTHSGPSDIGVHFDCVPSN